MKRCLALLLTLLLLRCPPPEIGRALAAARLAGEAASALGLPPSALLAGSSRLDSVAVRLPAAGRGAVLRCAPPPPACPPASPRGPRPRPIPAGTG